MHKVLVFGTGGVGGVYTWILRHAQVTAVCRSNYEAVKQAGIRINSAKFGKVTARPAAVVRTVREASGPFDFVVVCSKAFPGATPSTAETIKPAVGPSTGIVLCQNGIEIEPEYRDAFPSNAIISGVVYLPTTQKRPGYIEMGNLERLEIGTYPRDAPPAAKAKVDEFKRLFDAGGGTAKVYEDIQEMRWSKLMVNASWNPICALTLLDDANFLRSSPAARDMVKSVMLEVVATAKAKGYLSVDESLAEWQLSRALARLEQGGVEPSMLTDVREGRELEVEAIVGNLIRIARAAGIQTPRLETIYALAKGLNFALALNRSK